MNNREVFGFVPGKYSIHGGFVCGGDLIQSFTLADLVDDFLGASGRIGGVGGSCGGGAPDDQGFSYYQQCGKLLIKFF